MLSQTNSYTYVTTSRAARGLKFLQEEEITKAMD